MEVEAAAVDVPVRVRAPVRAVPAPARVADDNWTPTSPDVGVESLETFDSGMIL